MGLSIIPVGCQCICHVYIGHHAWATRPTHLNQYFLFGSYQGAWSLSDTSNEAFEKYMKLCEIPKDWELITALGSSERWAAGFYPCWTLQVERVPERGNRQTRRDCWKYSLYDAEGMHAPLSAADRWLGDAPRGIGCRKFSINKQVAGLPRAQNKTWFRDPVRIGKNWMKRLPCDEAVTCPILHAASPDVCDGAMPITTLISSGEPCHSGLETVNKAWAGSARHLGITCYWLYLTAHRPKLMRTGV